MNLLTSLIAILVLALLAVGISYSGPLAYFMMVIIFYAAFTVFLTGFVYRVVLWARAPVPFCIPTTGGQGKNTSLDQVGFFGQSINNCGGYRKNGAGGISV